MRGRPRIDSVPLKVRVHPDQLDALDAYIIQQPQPWPSRPGAIRAILADWLKAKGYLT